MNPHELAITNKYGELLECYISGVNESLGENLDPVECEI